MRPPRRGPPPAPRPGERAAPATPLSRSARPRPSPASGRSSIASLLEATALAFVAYTGYARIATLGEEVREPARTIPRAVVLALGITLAVYASVAVAVLLVLGPAALAQASAPLAERVAGRRAEQPAVFALAPVKERLEAGPRGGLARRDLRP